MLGGGPYSCTGLWHLLTLDSCSSLQFVGLEVPVACLASCAWTSITSMSLHKIRRWSACSHFSIAINKPPRKCFEMSHSETPRVFLFCGEGAHSEETDFAALQQQATLVLSSFFWFFNSENEMKLQMRNMIADFLSSLFFNLWGHEPNMSAKSGSLEVLWILVCCGGCPSAVGFGPVGAFPAAEPRPAQCAHVSRGIRCAQHSQCGSVAAVPWSAERGHFLLNYSALILLQHILI